MNSSNGDKTRNERFLDALVEEFLTMSDTDALAGDDSEALVKFGEQLLKNAREQAGKLRLKDAREKLSLVHMAPDTIELPSVVEAREYLKSRSNFTLAARGLDELSDKDVLELFSQVKSLEEDVASTDAEDGQA